MKAGHGKVGKVERMDIMDEYGRVVTQSELPPHSYTALVRDSQAMVE